MDNIISFKDKKKKQEISSPKEEMLQIIESVKSLILEDKLEGMVGIATGSDGKVFSIVGGEFDVIQMLGGLETTKYYLIQTSGISD